MSWSKPRKRRAFSLRGKGRVAAEDFGRRSQEIGTLQLDKVYARSGVTTVKGDYVVHGNGPYDLKRFAKVAGLKDVKVDTFSLEFEPCGDPECEGCS